MVLAFSFQPRTVPAPATAAQTCHLLGWRRCEHAAGLCAEKYAAPVLVVHRDGWWVAGGSLKIHLFTEIASVCLQLGLLGRLWALDLAREEVALGDLAAAFQPLGEELETMEQRRGVQLLVHNGD